MNQGRLLRTLLLSSAVGACATPTPTPRSASSAAPARLDLERCFEVSRALRAPTGLFTEWMPDGAHYLALDETSDGKRIVVVDLRGLEKRALYEPQDLERALLAGAGIEAEVAKRWSRSTGHTLSPNKDRLLIEGDDDLFLWQLGAPGVVRLTQDPATEQGATFSPDGSRVAFVREHHVFVVEGTGGAARQLTTEGNEDLLVGRLDWVYQEELYGRGDFNGMWWSPDSKKLALIALDQHPVPKITVTDHRGTHPTDEVWRYPKAGDPNPIATLSVVDVATGARQAIDLSSYPDEDRLIVRVGWTPDSSELLCQVQDRIQSWLDLLAANPLDGSTRRVLRDRTAAWITPVDGFEWIDGGARFLWLSERDGYAHLYLHDKSGALLSQVTRGEWEVDELLGYDAASSSIYFLGDRADSKGNQPYRVKLDGSELQALAPAGGTHAISMSPNFGHFLDTWSASDHPGSIWLRTSSGEALRALWQSDRGALETHGFAAPEFVTPKTRDGFEMEALLIKPPNFDPSKRYPVLCHVYAGPHASQVRDAFGGFNGWFHQMLAQEGWLIWICDNRSASGKGLVSQVAVQRNLGTQELADIEDGLDWLVAQGFADPQRIGIWGWSYGGYMSAFALTHSKRFKLGIAGAPVTDWSLYDSIYTERLMDLPSANAKGYSSSSVVKAAADLSGRLLLIHGMIDENVHVQNTLHFVEALQRANKPFDLMLYPGNRHGVVDPAQRKHLYSTMADFIRTNL